MDVSKLQPDTGLQSRTYRKGDQVELPGGRSATVAAASDGIDGSRVALAANSTSKPATRAAAAKPATERPTATAPSADRHPLVKGLKDEEQRLLKLLDPLRRAIAALEEYEAEVAKS